MVVPQWGGVVEIAGKECFVLVSLSNDVHQCDEDDVDGPEDENGGIKVAQGDRAAKRVLEPGGL